MEDFKTSSGSFEEIYDFYNKIKIKLIKWI